MKEGRREGIKPTTINCQLSTVNCQPSTINRQPSTINCQQKSDKLKYVKLIRGID
ncbi:MAG: hypothetical protein QNJ51_13245 [Calothrix sp. MO_167.B12]|nr:hypothetical protein [Calothrix sp. MO_167.B12]